LIIPCVTLNSLGHEQVLSAVLAMAGVRSLGSFVVALPFMALVAANPLYRQRLQQLVVLPEPTS
jgi:hypothetical protein